MVFQILKRLVEDQALEEKEFRRQVEPLMNPMQSNDVQVFALVEYYRKRRPNIQIIGERIDYVYERIVRSTGIGTDYSRFQITWVDL